MAFTPVVPSRLVGEASATRTTEPENSSVAHQSNRGAASPAHDDTSKSDEQNCKHNADDDAAITAEVPVEMSEGKTSTRETDLRMGASDKAIGERSEGSTSMDCSPVEWSSGSRSPSKATDCATHRDSPKAGVASDINQGQVQTADHGQHVESSNMAEDISRPTPHGRLGSPGNWLREQIQQREATGADRPIKTEGLHQAMAGPILPSSPPSILDPRILRRQQQTELQVEIPSPVAMSSPVSAGTVETSATSASSKETIKTRGRRCQGDSCNSIVLYDKTAEVLCAKCREKQHNLEQSEVQGEPTPASAMASPLSSLDVDPADPQREDDLDVDGTDNQAAKLAASSSSNVISPVGEPSPAASPQSAAPAAPFGLGEANYRPKPPFSSALRPTTNDPRRREHMYRHTGPEHSLLMGMGSSAASPRKKISKRRQGVAPTNSENPAAATALNTSMQPRELGTESGPIHARISTGAENSNASLSAAPLGVASQAPAAQSLAENKSRVKHGHVVDGSESRRGSQQTLTSIRTSSLSASRDLSPMFTPDASALPADVAFRTTSQAVPASTYMSPITSRTSADSAAGPKLEASRAEGEDSLLIPDSRFENVGAFPSRQTDTMYDDNKTQEDEPIPTSRAPTPPSVQRQRIPAESRVAIKSQLSPAKSSHRRTPMPFARDLSDEDSTLAEAEAGASDEEGGNLDPQAKPEKPDITWRDLIFLALRRGQNGRMTTNQATEWIQTHVPGYEGEQIKSSVAAVLSGYSESQKRVNAVFDKEKNPNGPPKWLWFISPAHRGSVDAEELEEKFTVALAKCGRPYLPPADSNATKAKKKQTMGAKKSAAGPSSAKPRPSSFAAKKTTISLHPSDNKHELDSSADNDSERRTRKHTQVSVKPSVAVAGQKRPAPLSSSPLLSEREVPQRQLDLGNSMSKILKAAPAKSSDPEADHHPKSPFYGTSSGQKPSPKKRKTDTHAKVDVGTEVQMGDTGQESLSILKPSATERIIRSTRSTYKPDKDSDSNDRGYFSDLEAKGHQPALDLGPAPANEEDALVDLFGHLAEDEAKRDAKHLPLYKEYDEDPQYGGKVDYGLKDLFAARPDKDPSQNGAFFDREAKMKEIAERPKRSDIRNYRIASDDHEAMPFLKTIRHNRDPNNVHAERGKAGPLWSDDEDDGPQDGSPNVAEDDADRLYDEDGVRKYKSLKELLEMPRDPELGLDKDRNLVFRERRTIGANGRVKRSRREWKTNAPKGI